MIPLIINPLSTKTKTVLKQLVDQYSISKNYTLSIKPLKEEITIGQIRELKKDLSISQPQKRMIVFYDFDKSGLETQNSLLKILEEKTDQNLFVLIVKNFEKIIPTIKSRAKIINSLNRQTETIDPLIEKTIAGLRNINNLAFLSNKDLLVTSKDIYLDQANKLLIYFEKELKKNDQNKMILVKIIKKILQTTYLVENNNLNPQLSFDNLLIFIWNLYKMK